MSSAEAPEAPAAAAAPAPVVDEIAAEVAATLTLAPPSDAGRERAMTVLPPSPDNIPKKALVKPKFPPEKAGKCTIDGCDKRVMSMTLNVSRYLVLPLPVWGKCDAKHHCRHCLRRVCSEHFKKTPSGYKVCSACLDAGACGGPGRPAPFACRAPPPLRSAHPSLSPLLDQHTARACALPLLLRLPRRGRGPRHCRPQLAQLCGVWH